MSVANRWALLAAIPLFLVMAVMAYLTAQFAVDARYEQAWIIHTYQVSDRLQAVLADALDVESSQRAYLVTRQERFLDRYRSGMARTQHNIDIFQSLTADNEVEQIRATTLRALIDARFKALDVSLANAVPVAAPLPLAAAMDQGNIRMDRLRDELARGRAEETSLLSRRLAIRNQAEREETDAAALAGLIAFAVLLGTALLLVRNNVRLAQSERKLENESAILQTTLDNIRDGIAMFASDGELCVFNDNFFNFLGFSGELAHKGTRVANFQATHPGNPSFEDMLKATERGDGYRVLSPQGRELDIYRVPVPTGGFVIVCMDITARMQAEQVIRQTQKMEAIGHLTGGIAHDFNNLLQIIGANLDLTAKDVSGNPKSAERLQNAIGAVSRGERLTGQLLAFARRQALAPRSTNLGQLTREMTDLLHRTLGEHVEVESAVAAGLWNTLVDPSQVENAVLNLAINARDAMPDGGKLTLEVANAFLDDAYAAQHAEVMAGQYVMVAVSDTGTGMSPDIVARVFEPFFTTKEDGRGTGLGLSQVYGFVKQSGGHIKIYSEVGQGTTVKLYLPRTRKPQDVADPVASGPVEGGTDCILVVEDDEGVRAAAVDMLTELGYTVLKAENGEQALTILTSGVSVDLLFTDVVMPGPIGARELARRAQALMPNIAVLYTSGYTQNAIVHNGKLDDGVFLLSKPYRREELARKLRTLLNPKRNSESVTTPAPKPDAAALGDAPLPGRLKVLVVEDEALIRMTVVDMLEELGIDAVEAGDGAQALALLQNDPAIDVLLTDLGLPGMNGRQLMEEARRLKPDLKVVIASGYATEREAGGMPDRVQQLMKPFDIAQLRRALASVTDS